MPFPDQTQNLMAAELKDQLALRLGLPVAQGADTNGNPTLSVGTLATGQQGAFMRIKPIDSLQSDALGNAQRVYTPHVSQIVLELSATAGVAVLTMANFAKLFGDVAQKGTKMEVYFVANGNAPALSGITGTPALEYWPDLYKKAASAT